MRFSPKTENEIIEERLWPEGDYAFKVTEAVEAVSKSGNDMIKMFVQVYKPDGKSTLLTDYLMESMLYKILHFCEAVGLTELYNSGQIKGDSEGRIQDFIGKEGTLKLGIRKSDGYPAQNTIKDYVVDKDAPKPKVAPVQAQKPVEDDGFEDEIPFN